MEQFLSRSVIKSRLRAICGHSGSDAQSGQTANRHHEYIRMAHDEVILRRQWRSTMRETLFTFGVDQRFYPYPTNARAENIQAIAVWSNGVNTASGVYLPLRKTSIPIVLDTDPISDAGGDAAAAQRAMPTRFHLKDQIEVWPRADIPYLGKIDHTISTDLSQDADVTVVDALAVLYNACSYEFEHLGDDSASASYAKRAEKRLRLISAWQEHGEVVSMDDAAVMHRLDGLDDRIDPSLIVDQRRPG